METRLFDPDNPPEWLDPAWWATTSNCDHLAHPAGVHQKRLMRAARLAHQTAMAEGLTDVVDIGAGDGALLALPQLGIDGSDYAMTGYEIIPDSVRVARYDRMVDVHLANVTREASERLDTPFTRHVCKATRGTRLVVCTEMLEHLENPHDFVRWLSNRCAWIVASSPHSETAERHEPNHAWAWDREGYTELFNNNGFVVHQVTDVEWSQVIVAAAHHTVRGWTGP